MKYLTLLLLVFLVYSCNVDDSGNPVNPPINDAWYQVFGLDSVNISTLVFAYDGVINLWDANSTKVTFDYYTNEDTVLFSMLVYTVYAGLNHYYSLGSDSLVGSSGSASIITDGIPVNFQTDVFYILSATFKSTGKYMHIRNLKVFKK